MLTWLESKKVSISPGPQGGRFERRGRVAQRFGDKVEQTGDAKVTDSSHIYQFNLTQQSRTDTILEYANNCSWCK